MTMIKNYLKNSGYLIAAFALTLLPLKTTAQNAQSIIPRDTLLQAAHEIMASMHYCALVTIDSTGKPQVRTMNPFPQSNEKVVWFATSRKSRKVSDIKKNPNVCVYYADHINAKGYVSLTGTAVVIDDKELLIQMKRSYWEGIPDWQNRFVLIKITPKTLDVTNYAHGVSGDAETSRAPRIEIGD
jgi:general stress protein 26